MLKIKDVEDKMRERGFVTYAGGPNVIRQFISAHMYDPHYEENTPSRKRKPVINVFVNIENDEFYCVYNLPHSIDTLRSPNCSPFTDDKHFDFIVGKFESEANWLDRLRL